MSNHYSPTADNQSRARQQAIPTAHYIGLDLGQTRDPSALAVMERSEISMGVSPVTFERLVQPRYSFRHLERIFQRGEIKICGHLPESETLAAELANMRIKVSLSGQDTYATWREGQHDDLVLAAALACWHAT